MKLALACPLSVTEMVLRRERLLSVVSCVESCLWCGLLLRDSERRDFRLARGEVVGFSSSGAGSVVVECAAPSTCAWVSFAFRQIF